MDRLPHMLLVAIAAMMLLSACARLAPTVEPVTISFACMNYARDQYVDLVERFEKANRDIRVQIVSAEEIAQQQRQGNTLVSSGNEVERLAAGADTFVWFARFSPADYAYLLNLQPFVNGDSSFAVQDFYPGTLDDLRWQKKLYGLPAQVLPILIFYDKGMFDAAGIAYPQIDWTWADLLKTAADLTEREGNEVSHYGFVDSFYSHTLLAMMEQYGVPLWNDDADPPRPLFDRPEVADVTRSYFDLAWTYNVMPVPEVGSNVMAFNLVNDGRATMWTSFAHDQDAHSHRIDLGLAVFPQDVEAANPRALYGFFASAGTVHPNAAWRWLSYLSENYQPMEGSLPGRRSVGEQMRWWKRLDEDARGVIEYALAHPASTSNPLNLPLQRALGAIIRDQVRIEDALADAQAQALDIQAELAVATPPVPQPVSPPTVAPVEAETTIVFAPVTLGEIDAYRTLAAVFTASHPDIHVEVVQGPVGLAERTAESDCFAGSYPVVAPEVRQSTLSVEPFLETSSDLSLNDFYAPMLKGVQYEGQLWGIPYEADALMVYYRPDRFVDGGVALPFVGWSIDDFLGAVVMLADGEQYGFTTREGAYGDLVFVLERMGARLVDDTGERLAPTFDDPTVVAALNRYVIASKEQPLTPMTPSTQSGWPDSMVWGMHPAGVATGQVAMWIDEIGNQAVAPPLSFETAVVPLPVGAQANTEFSVSAYYISAQSSQPETCWKWLVFLSDQPEVVQKLPARKSIAASPAWQVEESARMAFQATLEYDDAAILRLRWEIPWLGYAYPWLLEAFQSALAGGNAERALSVAQNKAEALVLCLEGEGGHPDAEILKTCTHKVDPEYPNY